LDTDEISYRLLRFDRDANRVVHFSEWSSLDAARRFFESPERVEIRRRAGVKAPEFLYLHEIEGVLERHRYVADALPSARRSR
jgi:heme-degrading monooxygenase HmoA